MSFMRVAAWVNGKQEMQLKPQLPNAIVQRPGNRPSHSFSGAEERYTPRNVY